ncbi:uncharacterized protein DNG_06835 [Cephalotrichum gorgonifer]|uniref:GMC_oxred_C domain-containing protein n=1 Tax=Cephalotrichum gorgonifer TaxID=2041049 RepID=A0AAE8N3I0_9PEZI|nr:uncharacterized protein DNG_06835 [Cephalotrichum gorgonifer]
MNTSVSRSQTRVAEFGGDEWTWDPLVYYLRKSASYHDDPGRYDKDLQKIGPGGPLPISHAELVEDLAPFRQKETKGVTVITDSAEQLSFYSTRKVIVAQGVFETPKLLMLSDIGPKDQLSSHGIKTLVDHPGVPFVLRLKDGYTWTMSSCVLAQGTPPPWRGTRKTSTGPVGSGLLALVGFPRIDDYLEDKSCMEQRGPRDRCRGPCSPRVSKYPWEMSLESDGELHRAVLDRCQTAFHPTGTARLAKIIDQGVIHPQLRVHGIKSLRVVDASIIPVIPDCRIQNSVFMIGDMIKAAHRDLYKA